MPFDFRRLDLLDIVLIEARTFPDNRGHFLELYGRSAFSDYGIPDHFVQDNLSHSHRGVLRGLHYQIHPAAQGKLITVLAGEIFDVAVDIRRGSPTFGHWVGATISASQPQLLYVPIGFAHGFCVLSESADVLYKVTADYVPALERGIVWNDPDIGISWPVADPVLSPKDSELPCLRAADSNFIV